jgi:hypothetical protein
MIKPYFNVLSCKKTHLRIKSGARVLELMVCVTSGETVFNGSHIGYSVAGNEVGNLTSQK